jgi:hypothetical protein
MGHRHPDLLGVRLGGRAVRIGAHPDRHQPEPVAGPRSGRGRCRRHAAGIPASPSPTRHRRRGRWPMCVGGETWLPGDGGQRLNSVKYVSMPPPIRASGKGVARSFRRLVRADAGRPRARWLVALQIGPRQGHDRHGRHTGLAALACKFRQRGLADRPRHRAPPPARTPRLPRRGQRQWRGPPRPAGRPRRGATPGMPGGARRSACQSSGSHPGSNASARSGMVSSPASASVSSTAWPPGGGVLAVRSRPAGRSGAPGVADRRGRDTAGRAGGNRS